GAGDLQRAVYAYNHAGWYVNEVLSLAQVYAQGAGVTFALDDAQASLDAARSAVTQAAQRLAAAQTHAQRQALLSARLDAQPAVERARTVLAAARVRLARAQADATPVSFSPSLAAVFGAPSYSGGWAFPVGGGAGEVTVAHTHHDYPAADIAAPAGSPVYALSDGVVEQTWADDPTCGIGLRFRGADGQTWTYCHLAYLDPSVAAGAPLASGAQVGLVGSTGDATGPHLHLQLDPATSYPQAEPWFAAFAGSAFTWKDDAGSLEQTTAPGVRFLAVSTPGAAPQRPVFAVVPSESAPVVFFNRP
ncbi:MAG TPA: M23 family metallopeptidase, partial [Gaiellaceae bacterium]|nr:M23 family metallopeptidase [Gaiellaceae bacterium]